MKLKVTYFFRPPNSQLISIELLFRFIQSMLPAYIKVENYSLKHQPTNTLGRIQSLIEVIKHQGDINHITGDVHFIALFLNKQRTILTIHDLEFIERERGLKRKILKFFWVTMPVNRVKYVTVISEETKRSLLAMVHPRFEKKIVVIHNAINLEVFSFSPKEKLSKRPVILQIGTRHNKNILRLIEALEGISCELRIIGELNEEQKLKLTKFSISYVNLVNISGEAIVDEYLNCDMLVFVSTYEGFGLPILEANAIGRPVVTSNISSMPEVAGIAAILVDPFNVKSIREGIQEVIFNNELRTQLVNNGKENIKRFSPEIITKQYVELYRKLLRK